MLEFLKKLFGSKSAVKPVPYKVETPAPKVEQFPFPSQAAEKPKAKKPSVKKATTRKPRAPRAPKS